jgi:transcriptional regulator with XRE-family HTH domain
VPQRSSTSINAQLSARRSTSFEPKVASVFGGIIRAERVKQAIAQDEFALFANIDRSYYGKLERGERQPSLALILRIAGGLGISASSILERVEEQLAAEASRN